MDLLSEMLEDSELIKSLREQGFQVRGRYYERPSPLEEIAKAMNEDASDIEQGYEKPPKEIRLIRTDTIIDDGSEYGYLVLWKEDQSGVHNEDLWRRTEPTFQSDFLMREHFPEWLGDVKDKTVLDACCGEGYVARKLASLGAKVYGFDNNPEMIYLARSMEEKEPFGSGYKSGISYQVADLMDVDEKRKFSNRYNVFHYPESFDIAVLSGIPPFLNSRQLYEAHRKIARRLKPNGLLLVTTLHTDAYFQRAESGWMVFTSEPYPTAPTQQGSLDFYAPSGELAFSGSCYFHTPQQMRKAISEAGLEVIAEYAPLASEEDIKHFPERWKDEVRIPFHLALLGKKMSS